MRRPSRALTIPLSALALLLGLASCSATTSASSSADADSGSTEIGENTILLDVRTPEEFATGHLEGAELIDFNAGDVAEMIPQLDPDAEYLIYCRSGNRAGQAIALMEQAGFTHLTNLGSLEQAAEATGLAIVQD